MIRNSIGGKMRKIIVIVVLFILTGCQLNNVDENEENIISEESRINTKNTADETAEKGETYEEPLRRVKVEVDVLNFRDQPHIDGILLGQVFQNSVYEVIEEKRISNDNTIEVWYKLNVGDNYTGWVAGWFCVETSEALQDNNIAMDSLTVEIKDYYYEGNTIDFDDLMDWETFDVFFRSESSEMESVSNIFVLSESGSLIIRLQDSLGRSRDIVKDIEVFEYSETKKTLFAEMDFDSKIVGQEDVRDINYNEKSEGFLSIVKGELIAWYKVEYNGQECYMYEADGAITFSSAKFARYNIALDNGEVIIVDGGGEASAIYADKGIIGISNYPDISTYVDIFSGEIYEFAYREYNEDHTGFMSFNHFSEGRFRDEELMRDYSIYNITEEGFELVFKEESEHIGLENIDFISKNIVEYSIYYDRTNPWKSTDPRALYERYRVTVDDDQVSKELISEPNRELNKVDYEEEIVVYSEMDETSEILGMFKRNDIVNIEYSRTFDVIDSKLCDWFYVDMGKFQGYSYRSRSEYDGSKLHLEEPMAFILNSGETMPIETDGFGAFIYSIDDSLIFNDTIIFYYSFEGSGSWCKSADDGSVLDVPMKGYIYVSPQSDYLIDVSYPYIEGYCELVVYQISGKEYIEQCRLRSNEANFHDIEWVGDYELGFTVNTGSSNEGGLVSAALTRTGWEMTSDIPEFVDFICSKQ